MALATALQSFNLTTTTTGLGGGMACRAPPCQTPLSPAALGLASQPGRSLPLSENWTLPLGHRPRLGRRGHDHDQLVGRQVTKKVSIVFGMILIPLVALFGSLGNFLSLRVLVHHRMRNSTNMLLAALALSDLLVLLHALYFSFLRVYCLNDPEAGERLRTQTFPVLGPYTSVVTARITTGLTTMLSVERLVAVYLPMKAKAMCGRIMTGTCIGLIFLVTAMAFVPTAMKYHAVHMTVGNQSRLRMELTPLGHNEYFFLVYGNVLNVLFRLLPIVVLILVNVLIALAINKTWSFRRSMSGGVMASYEQNRITLMLLMVSLVFLLCILPGAIHSIMTQAYEQYSRFGAQNNIYAIFGYVTYFLETFNSSINFVIYMAYSTKFNRTYRKIFSCQRRRRPAEGLPRRSTQSIIRFPIRPSKGSQSSMSSYRELYHLNQLRHNKCPTSGGGALRNGSMHVGAGPSGLGAVQEQEESMMVKKYHSKYTVSETSCSNHSGGHSHSSGGYSHSEHSQGSSSGHQSDRYNEHSVHNVDPSPEKMYS